MIVLEMLIVVMAFGFGFYLGRIRQIDKHDDEIIRYETDNHKYNLNPIDYYANMDCASRPVKKREEN